MQHPALLPRHPALFLQLIAKSTVGFYHDGEAITDCISHFTVYLPSLHSWKMASEKLELLIILSELWRQISVPYGITYISAACVSHTADCRKLEVFITSAKKNMISYFQEVLDVW